MRNSNRWVRRLQSELLGTTFCVGYTCLCPPLCPGELFLRLVAIYFLLRGALRAIFAL